MRVQSTNGQLAARPTERSARFPAVIPQVGPRGSVVLHPRRSRSARRRTSVKSAVRNLMGRHSQTRIHLPVRPRSLLPHGIIAWAVVFFGWHSHPYMRYRHFMLCRITCGVHKSFVHRLKPWIAALQFWADAKFTRRSRARCGRSVRAASLIKPALPRASAVRRAALLSALGPPCSATRPLSRPLSVTFSASLRTLGSGAVGQCSSLP